MVGIGCINYLFLKRFWHHSCTTLTEHCVQVRFGSISLTVQFVSGSVCHTVRVRSVRFVLLKDMGSIVLLGSVRVRSESHL